MQLKSKEKILFKVLISNPAIVSINFMYDQFCVGDIMLSVLQGVLGEAFHSEMYCSNTVTLYCVECVLTMRF